MEYSVKDFRELTKVELYDILSLRNKVFIVEQNCPYQDFDGKDFESYHLMVKESDSDRIVAYLRIMIKGISFDQNSISRVIVDEKYRGKGIARDMLNKAIEFIGNRSKKEIKLSAQEYLIHFYESLGFSVVSERYLEDGIPHVEMVYDLNV